MQRNVIIGFLISLLLAILPLSVFGQELSFNERQQTVRADGSIIDWYLNQKRGSEKRGLLVLAQGGGCQSVLKNSNIERAKAVLPNFVILTVEKYGVKPNDQPRDPQGECSPLFYERSTVNQRVEDYEQVIAEVIKKSWWNGQLVLFGGSEGGAVVAILAARVDANAAVIFSTGIGIPLSEAFRQVAPPAVVANADAQFATIRREPQSAKLWGGNSYHWWADIMDRRLVDDLLRPKIPILLLQGERDQFAPVVAGRATRAAFTAAQRCNLTYREYPGYDHGMVDQQGNSHMQEVLQQVSEWLEEHLQVSSNAKMISQECE